MKNDRNLSDYGEGLRRMAQAVSVKTERLDAIRSHLYANGFLTNQSRTDSVAASRFATMATDRVAPLTCAITDASLTPKWRSRFAELGVEIIHAEADARR
jgi:hypothetical protein